MTPIASQMAAAAAGSTLAGWQPFIQHPDPQPHPLQRTQSTAVADREVDELAMAAATPAVGLIDGGGIPLARDQSSRDLEEKLAAKTAHDAMHEAAQQFLRHQARHGEAVAVPFGGPAFSFTNEAGGAGPSSVGSSSTSNAATVRASSSGNSPTNEDMFSDDYWKARR